MLRLAGLLALWLAAWAAAGQDSGIPVITASDVYKSEDADGNVTVLVPNTAVAGEPLQPAAPPVDQAEECAAACRQRPGGECHWFTFCGTQGGCSDGSSQPFAYRECRLLGGTCSVQPTVPARGLGVNVVSGFPVTPLNFTLYGFSEVDGQGILGADFSCDGSVVPGACAFNSLVQALRECVSVVNCRSVVVYQNGTDACSPPMYVMKAEGTSPGNTFVAPTVITLQQSESQSLLINRVYNNEGEVVQLPEGELSPNGLALSKENPWLGCMKARGALMDGRVLAVRDGVPSPEDCCRLCRGLEDAGGGVCNVWNFCSREGGCSFQPQSISQQSVSLALGQCELRFQELAMLQVGWPPALLDKGVDIPFTCGAPLSVWGPELPGYTRLPGRGVWTYGNYLCPDSLAPETQECIQAMPFNELGQYCSDDPSCAAFMLKPGGLLNQSYDLAIFKNETLPGNIVYNPTACLYIKNAHDPGGLSAGAIAGIAVASVAAGVALAVAAWLLLRRRRRQRARRLAAHISTPKALEVGLVAPGGGSSDPGVQQSQAAAAAAAARRFVQLSRGGNIPPSPFSSADAGDAAFDGDSSSTRVFAHSGSDGGSGLRVAVAGTARPSPQLPLAGYSAAGSAATMAQAARMGAGTALPAGTTSPEGSVAMVSSPQHQQYPQYHQQQQSSWLSGQPSTVSLSPSPTTTSIGAVGGGGSGRGSIVGQPHAAAGAPDAMPLAELVEHVAQQDAVAGLGSGPTGASPVSHHVMLPGALPAGLLEWVVDPESVSYLRWPNGKLKELGCGASAHVYQAMYNGEVVAAKEMDIGSSAAVQEAFLNEANRLQQLRHPHIVGFYGVMLAGSKGVVLMEYAEGRDLHGALELMAAGKVKERLFGWQRRGRRVAYDVAKALNYLHSKGVVHMDVKSNNVLLTASGTAKLADCAFSRDLKNTFLSELPLVGTFAWIAPEVLLGGRECSAAVDIYSFGVLLWEIVTGERPQRGSLRMPRVPQECPQEVSDLIMECLSESPAERPTAQQLLQRLRGLLERSGKEAAGRREPLGLPPA